MAITDLKTATQGQWEDLASRVKAKSDVVITMTTTDPGEGSALAANNYIGVYGGDPIIMDYSTSEINTGAKWIDGSTIYKKTISCGALPNNTSTTTAHNISNLLSVIKIEGYAEATQTNYFTPLPMSDVDVYANETNIIITSTSDRSAYQFSYITLYYTKSS